MTYELCKKLKEAGFQQGFDEHSGGKWIESDGDIHDHESGREEYYVPTLSELISACGDRFIKLEKMHMWVAVGLEVLERYGDTPQEAVSNLWLALNKNNGHTN